MLKKLIILVVLIFIGVPVFAQTRVYPDSIPFDTAVNYSVGDMPISAFCCDLDGDLDLDIAVAMNLHNGGDNVQILKNNGGGSFEAKVGYGYAEGNWPYSIFCADLDGDADVDLALTNLGDTTVSILKNDGNGGFPDTVKAEYFGGNMPNSLFCADLDMDSDLDIAVGFVGVIINITILKNNGNGGFQVDSLYGAAQHTEGVFCADLDGDLDLDLAVPGFYRDSISILKNVGNGTFEARVDYPVGSKPRAVFCGDLDSDTDMDLVVANEGSHNVSILKNYGDGTFHLDSNYVVRDLPHSVFCADLDGDFDLDIVVASERDYGSNAISILRNNGDGTFQSKVDYRVGVGPSSVFCADLDGDGDLEIVVANILSDNISILRNLTQVPANQPPWPFSIISPAEKETTYDTTTFRWQTPYDPNFGDQIRYDLHMSIVPSFDPDSTIVYDSIPLAGYAVDLDTGVYYWKVKAFDNWGAERWSNETWNFFSFLLLGDTNGDGQVRIGDVIFLIHFLFRGGPPPQPLEVGDVNCDGEVSITDVIYLINYLFRGGPPPGC